MAHGHKACSKEGTRLGAWVLEALQVQAEHLGQPTDGDLLHRLPVLAPAGGSIPW